MKNKKHYIVFLFFSAYLSSCSIGTDTYFPLSNGITWEYQVSKGVPESSGVVKTTIISNLPQRELNGKKVIPQKVVEVQENGQVSSLSFIATDNEGIYKLAEQGPQSVEPTIIEAFRFYYIKSPIQVGTTWESKMPIPILATEFIQKNIIESTNEVITVPAGTFEKCIKVKSTGNASIDLRNSATFSALSILGIKTLSISVERQVWYAPGVGLVKSITSTKLNNLSPAYEMLGIPQNNTEITQLVSFKK